MNMEVKKMEKKAAIYARVSSQRQREGETIKSQVDALRTFAKQEGYQINDNWIFLDDGISGKSLQRPALDELRDMIRIEPIQFILVHSTDRLARNYSHQLILLEEFRKYGVKVCFLKNPPAEDTPEATLLNHFQGIFAEYERALILDRSRRGRIYKAKQGNPASLPSVAYGYKRIKTGQEVTVEVSEEEAKVVKYIFRLYVYEKRTLAEIARILTQEGVKTVQNKPAWTLTTIRHMLKNTAYIGTAYFGKTEVYDGTSNRIRHYKSGKALQPKHARRILAEEKWLPIAMPIIISENDFEQAQKQLKINKEFASRNTREPGLLQGLIFCGVCGNPFYKRSRKYNGHVKGYYYCKSHGDRALKKCSNGWAYQQELDNLVYEELMKLLQNPSLIRAELSRRAKESSDLRDHERKELAYKQEVAKISEERDRLLDAYQKGLVSLEGLKKRYQESDRRRSSLEKEIKRIQALKFDNAHMQDLEKGFEAILQRIKLCAENLDFKEKQKIVRLLVEQVAISPKGVKVIHCVSSEMITQEFCQLSSNGAD
jgi:site-specific DNA recombinase